MNNIRAARINAGFSQKEVAITLGVSVPTVSDWESGKKFPSGKNLIKLAQVLNSSTDYLLGYEATEKSPAPKTEDGTGETAQRFTELVARLTPEQQQLLLVQLRAWTEQNQKQASSVPPSAKETGP